MPSLQQLLIFILSLPPRPNNSYRKKTSTLFWSLSSSHVLLRLPTRGSSGSVLTKIKQPLTVIGHKKQNKNVPPGFELCLIMRFHTSVNASTCLKNLVSRYGLDSNNTTMLNFFMSKWQNRKKLIPNHKISLWLLENEPSTQIVAPSVVFTGN